MSTPKLVVGTLALVAALFAASVWMGALQREKVPKPSEHFAWAVTVKNLLGVRERGLSASEITSSCYRNGVFRVVRGQSCTAEIGESATPIRAMKLGLAGRTADRPGHDPSTGLDPGMTVKVTVTLRPRQKAAPVMLDPATLDIRQLAASIKLLREGASITLECVQALAEFCEVDLL